MSVPNSVAGEMIQFIKKQDENEEFDARDVRRSKIMKLKWRFLFKYSYKFLNGFSRNECLFVNPPEKTDKSNKLLCQNRLK